MLPKFLSIAIFFAVWIDRSLEEILPCTTDLHCYKIAAENELNVGLVPILVIKAENIFLEQSISKFFDERIPNIKILKVIVRYNKCTFMASYLFYKSSTGRKYPFLVMLNDNKLVKSIAFTTITPSHIEDIFNIANAPYDMKNYVENHFDFLGHLRYKLNIRQQQNEGRSEIMNLKGTEWPAEPSNDVPLIPPNVVYPQEPQAHPTRFNFDLNLDPNYDDYNPSTGQGSSTGQATRTRKRSSSRSPPQAGNAKRSRDTIVIDD